ncbi:MAG: hypothetical protein K0R05_4210 [Anaerocolumna sp.]|nr:hypothetical protein [Anaerocolumna sp.]
MQGYNCIMVFSTDSKKLLFCKRRKDPYKGLYNLVGGKIEAEEEGMTAGGNDIELSHMMDFTYYNQNCYVEVYAGILKQEVELREEANPLIWLAVTENYFDLTRFAGEGNIGHMLEQVLQYGMGNR